MSIYRLNLLRQIRARPRIFIAALVALIAASFAPSALGELYVTRALVGWNTGADLYVLLATLMMMSSTSSNMRRRAELQDEGAMVILSLASIAAVASLMAIAVELTVVKDIHGLARTLHIALAGMTVVSSWAFIQVMFALHYAHQYYVAKARGEPGGLAFPGSEESGSEEPGYADFFYFAAIIGTSGQTADVALVTTAMRRTGTLHCILAYLFNTVVLALLINICASLL